MARELVSPAVMSPRLAASVLPRLRRARDKLEILPRTPALGRVAYTPALVTYVAILGVVGLGLGAWLVRAPTDALTIAVASTVVFLMALYAVRSLPAMQSYWSPSVFLNLGLSVTFGPIGAAAASAAEALGSAMRLRNGWFRTLFNLVDFFLADVAAWAVFNAMRHVSSPLPSLVIAGLCAGLVQLAVNYGMLAVVVRIADPSVPFIRLLSGSLPWLPFSTGYGLAAFAFVVMHDAAGLIGFGALLVPVILLQGFLVVFAVRINAYEEQRAEHQKEREALLQRAVDASESERRRIARDLHDGVVQNLAGMAFTLTATAASV